MVESINQEEKKSHKSVFETLYTVDVSDKIEKKKSGNNELDYLNWAYAWAETKKRYPDATYDIEEYGEGRLPFLRTSEGYVVKTYVTIEGLTLSMYLPVMDGANKAMLDHPYEYTVKSGTKNVEKASMTDINKTIMRCLVKNIAMHGLGLPLYYGERISDEAKTEKKKEQRKQSTLINYKAKIIEKAKALIENGVESSVIYDAIQETSGDRNPNSIENVETCKKVMKALDEMQKRGLK